MTREEREREQNNSYMTSVQSSYRSASAAEARQNNASYAPNPDEYSSSQNQNPYGNSQHYYPRRRHHWFRWIVLAVAAVIAVTAIGIYQKGESQPAQPQTVNRHTTINNNHSAPRSAAVSKADAQNLERELQQIQLNQQDQQQLMSAYEKLSSAQQAKVYDKVQHYKNYVPTNAAKREIIKQYLQHQQI